MMQNIFGFPNTDIDNNVDQNEAADADSTSVLQQGGHGSPCKR